jgi:tetratricopeptide (TPR) repeat protein
MDPVYTHNDYLQLAAEYGIVAMVAFLAFFAAHLRRGAITARRLGPRRIGATHRVLSNAMALNLGALGAIAAYAVHSFFDFNLHIPANILLMAFVFGLLANNGVEQYAASAEPRSWKRIAAGSAIVVLSLTLAIQIWRLAPGEFYAEQARVAVRDRQAIAGISFALQGLRFEKQNPDLYYYLGRSRVLAGEEQSSSVARDSFFLAALPAYETARRLSPLDETYWVELGLTFDSLGRFKEAEWMFTEALRLDPKSPPIRGYYTAHLERWAGKQPPDGAYPKRPEG